ncbi:hypothetical protein HZS_1694 [Henneguya salminicola]|nr:hypothetical protein HZS_1694 [Henneguya salminicola]
MTKGNPLNNDTRARIIESYNRGNSCQKIAEIFDHNRTTVHNVVTRYLLTDELKIKLRVTCAQKKLTPAQEMEIKDWVDENCTISLKTISNKCMQEFGVRICKSTAANILTDFSYTLKRIHIVPERRNTPETIDCHPTLNIYTVGL